MGDDGSLRQLQLLHVFTGTRKTVQPVFNFRSCRVISCTKKGTACPTSSPRAFCHIWTETKSLHPSMTKDPGDEVAAFQHSVRLAHIKDILPPKRKDVISRKETDFSRYKIIQ